MKRKFFLHRQNAPMAADHVVYVVWVGESVRDQRILTKLVAWAFAHQATLQSWSEDIDYYLDYESQRVFSGRGLLDFGFVRAELTAAEALDLAEGNKWDSYEKTLSQPKVFLHMIRTVDPSRVNESKSKITPSKVLSHTRKNLSERYEGDRFIISFI